MTTQAQKDASRRYYQKNKEKLNKRHKEYSLKNKERINETRRNKHVSMRGLTAWLRERGITLEEYQEHKRNQK